MANFKITRLLALGTQAWGRARGRFTTEVGKGKYEETLCRISEGRGF